MSGIWHVQLEYSEMDAQYCLLVAGTDDHHQKSFRNAVRIPVFATAEQVAKALTDLAQQITRRIEPCQHAGK